MVENCRIGTTIEPCFRIENLDVPRICAESLVIMLRYVEASIQLRVGLERCKRASKKCICCLHVLRELRHQGCFTDAISKSACLTVGAGAYQQGVIP